MFGLLLCSSLLSMLCTRVDDDPVKPDLEDDDPRVTLVADLISAESYCEDLVDMRRVATVVANRVASPEFPDTYQKVIFANRQFSSTRRRGYGTEALRCDSARSIAQEVLAGQRYLDDDVLYFYNPALLDSVTNWTERLRRGTVLKGRHHRFAKVK